MEEEVKVPTEIKNRYDEYQRKAFVLLGVLIVFDLIIFFTLFFYFNHVGHWFIASILLFLLNHLVWSYVNDLEENINMIVRENIINTLLKSRGELQFHKKAPPIKELLKSPVIPNHIGQKRNSYIKGMLGSDFVEVGCYELYDGTGRGTSQVFKGIAVTVPLPKELNSQIIIVVNLNDLNIIQFDEYGPSFEKYKASYPEFEKTHLILSEDQSEAEEIFNSNFLHNFVEADKLANKIQSYQGIEAGFFGSKSLILIPTKKSPYRNKPFFRKVSWSQYSLGLAEDLNYIFKIIDQYLGRDAT